MRAVTIPEPAKSPEHHSGARRRIRRILRETNARLRRSSPDVIRRVGESDTFPASQTPTFCAHRRSLALAVLRGASRAGSGRSFCRPGRDGGSGAAEFLLPFAETPSAQPGPPGPSKPAPPAAAAAAAPGPPSAPPSAPRPAAAAAPPPPAAHPAAAPSSLRAPVAAPTSIAVPLPAVGPRRWADLGIFRPGAPRRHPTPARRGHGNALDADARHAVESNPKRDGAHARDETRHARASNSGKRSDRALPPILLS
jgi:hypothetical protein